MKVRWATFYHLRTAQVTNTILKTHVTLTVILFLQHIEMYKTNNIKNIFIYVMSYSISLYFVLLVLFYTADRNSWSRYVRHYRSFFPANIENNRHKWKFFEKEKVQYLLIGQKANYLLNKQSRAKIWYTHLHIWRNFRSTKHWICFHNFKVMFVVSFILYSIC